MEPKIWCLWEPRGGLPGYLRACVRTIERNAGVPVRLLDASDIEELAPRMSVELAGRVTDIAQRSDYYRSHLLAAQGGMWLDVDVVILRELTFAFRLLDDVEVVSRESVSGHASTNILAARPESAIVGRWIDRQEAILHELAPGAPLPWTGLGATALTESIGDGSAHLLPSSVVAPVPWTESDRFLSRFERVERILRDEPAAVMLYNARFPTALRRMTEEEVLASPMLMSRLLRVALGLTSPATERRPLDRVGRPLEIAGARARRLARGLRRRLIRPR